VSDEENSLEFINEICESVRGGEGGMRKHRTQKARGKDIKEKFNDETLK
jgi:hypothetical protein